MAAFVAVGTTELASGDFTVAAGTSVILCLIAASGAQVAPGSFAEVQLKASNSEYFTVGALRFERQGAVLKNDSGTDCVYRIVRKAGSVAFGVDKI